MADKYTIRTIADFAAVPEDRLSECLQSFADFLDVTRQLARIRQEKMKVSEFPDGFLEFEPGVFHWIDDGMRGVSEFSLVDKATGGVVLEMHLAPE